MAIAVGANIAAYATTHSLPREIFVIVALGVNVVGLYLFSWVTRALDRAREKSSEATMKQMNQLAALPLIEVRPRALDLISNPQRFRCKRSESTAHPLLAQVGPSLREFLSQFESVEEIGEAFKAGRRWLGHSTARPGFIRVGLEFEGSELVVRPGEDQVFIVHSADDILHGLPSIYHEILALE